MNNNDERDYAEEAANRRLLAEECDPPAMCEMTSGPHRLAPASAVMVMPGGTSVCEECAVVQVRLAVRTGRDIHLRPIGAAPGVAASPPAEDFYPAGPVELLDLLAAVLAAVDIPPPATDGDAEVYRRVLEERLLPVRSVLASLLFPRPVLRRVDVTWRSEYIREDIARHPVDGYRHNSPGGAS